MLGFGSHPPTPPSPIFWASLRSMSHLKAGGSEGPSSNISNATDLFSATSSGVTLHWIRPLTEMDERRKRGVRRNQRMENAAIRPGGRVRTENFRVKTQKKGKWMSVDMSETKEIPVHDVVIGHTEDFALCFWFCLFKCVYFVLFNPNLYVLLILFVRRFATCFFLFNLHFLRKQSQLW